MHQQGCIFLWKIETIPGWPQNFRKLFRKSTKTFSTLFEEVKMKHANTIRFLFYTFTHFNYFLCFYITYRQKNFGWFIGWQLFTLASAFKYMQKIGIAIIFESIYTVALGLCPSSNYKMKKKSTSLLRHDSVSNWHGHKFNSKLAFL